MILQDLILVNFRTHKNLRVKLKPGITGIVGDNGTGKSSIVEAIQFLLTGELFTGTKEEAINIEADTGYVAGSFILNGKLGRIERHLDVSKIVLKYDGVEYKKATECKELWDKLLQLNPDIIKRVIIAQQGHIPLLFSGDPSVREKIFQKIFLVPPTEKIRALIWKDYIKQAPPTYPEEDIIALNNQKEYIDSQVKKIRKQLDELKLLSEEEQDHLRNHITFLRRCIEEEGKATILQQAFQEIQNKSLAAEHKVKDLERSIAEIKIDNYRSAHSALLQQKTLYTQKLKIEESLGKLEYPCTPADRLIGKTRMSELRKVLDELKARLISNIDKLDEVRSHIKSANNITEDDQICSQCGQLVKDHKAYLNILEEREKELNSQIHDGEIAIRDTESELYTLQDEEENYLDYERHEKELKEQLRQFDQLSFSEESLTLITQVVQRYEKVSDELNKAKLEYNELKSQTTMLAAELQGLARYTGELTAQQDLAVFSSHINQNVENTRLSQEWNVDLRVKESELKALNQRIKSSEENHKKNVALTKYTDILKKAYDILSVSQFPRKLILNYADLVTDYLQENLELFNIPYKARVADNFKIEMIDDAGRILPTVSGGQEMQVGISLHLALHDLFSQAFPLMIIDEGTTHLDSTNRKAYFEIIKTLKAKDKIKQIIIIDHDPQLAEVVDHVIELKKE